MSAHNALRQLERPTTVDERLWMLRQLVQFWHGPIEPGDGMSDDELASTPLPQPLRWWYRWAGHRLEVMSGQNVLLEPQELLLENDRLHFYAENQGVYFWSTLPHGVDPPVFGRYRHAEPWQRERVTLSEHLILACMFEALNSRADCRATTAWLEEERFLRLVEHVPPVAIAPWRWLGMQFFAGDGTLMWAAENEDRDGRKGWSVAIGARTARSLGFLKPLLDERWEHIAV